MEHTVKGYTLMNKRFILNTLVLLFGLSVLTVEPVVKRVNNAQRAEAQRAEAQRKNTKGAHTQKGTTSKTHTNDANINEQIEEPTFEESWSKVLRLKWTSLSRNDAWNIGATIVTCGVIVYLCKHMPKGSAANNGVRPPHDNNQGPGRGNNHIHKPRDTSNKPVNNAERACDICFDDKKGHEFTTLSCCGHDITCTDCFIEMMDGWLKEKSTEHILCPNRACGQRIDEKDVRNITHAHPKTYNTYLDVVWKEWRDKNTKQCPTPRCTYEFEHNEGMRESIKCPQCRQTYCSNCLVQHSTKMTCDQAKEDLKLTGNKSAAARADDEWKRQHSKKCPRCKADIEKNNGCNHMTCKCSHQFCWECLRPWTPKTCNCPMFPVQANNGQQDPQPFQWNENNGNGLFGNWINNLANNAQRNNQGNANQPQNVNNNRNNVNIGNPVNPVRNNANNNRNNVNNTSNTNRNGRNVGRR
jgi:hypothetical protein